ncbi:hypothetical protein C818_02134 [Lachnospiraceae bacterium MD308]|nr:hypothetical protein C818_02134 [Lachnospiraceae bacterium MD308]
MANISADIDSYDVIVGYGIGLNYEERKRYLKGKVKFNYLADKRWETTKIQEYDGIPIIRWDELQQLEKALIVLFPKSESVRSNIIEELKETKADIYYVHDLFELEHCISGEDLISLLPKTEYRDDFQNCIMFDRTVPSNIKIYFSGEKSLVKIGCDVFVGYLDIYCGNNGKCLIGDKTSVQGAELTVSEAEVRLGENCMLSSGIRIRTHDWHHIFDKKTSKRINYARNVIIGNRVWIGQDAILAPGANIGVGSIVGERAVTSSSFGDNMIIAGCPAKIIRENICWTIDNTSLLNHNRLEESVDDMVLKYINDNNYL